MKKETLRESGKKDKLAKEANRDAGNQEFIKIREHMKDKLNPMRYEHTLGVTYTCMALAMRYEYDLKKAELAGLLHDCAKRYNENSIIKKCLNKGIELTESELSAPAIVHAKLGAWMAEHKYGITDPEILSAIACHTTGKPAMGLLDKILYVADYIEPGRDRAPLLGEMRKLAFVNLDEALYRIMKGILEYLTESETQIDDMTRVAFEYYDSERLRGREESATVTEPWMELKEEIPQNDTVKQNGKNRRKSTGRQKRRRHPNH